MAGEGSQAPNILLIMTDNQPGDLLGCSGNAEIQTPHLDRLAAQGIRFSSAYCPNGMCSPCRASVLTGLLPSQHGIHTWLDDRLMDTWPENWNGLSGLTALPEVLGDNGYDTALIGKYHVGSPAKPQNGFRHWVTFPYGHTRSFWSNTIIEDGKQSFYEGHSVDCFTDRAVRYIQARDARRPFFLFLAYNAPYGHWPAIQGPARNRFAHLYEDCPMNSVPREGLSAAAIRRYDMKKHQSGGGIDYSAELATPNDLTSLRNYYSQMSMVDDGVGTVLEALQQAGIEEETLVVFTADHGFSLGSHGFWGHGQATWPSNTHRAAFSIPLLVRHVGQIEPGQTSGRLVSSVDLFATLLDYAGIPLPQSPATPASRTFAPWLRGESAAWRDEVFMEQEETRSVRTDRWLYMRRFAGSNRYRFEDELYDLSVDPGERRNIFAEPEYSTVVTELQVKIDDFFSRVSVPEYDLWRGGAAKANSDKPWLWQDAWGAHWEPTFD